MEYFIREWSYLGVFVGIVITGIGFPMPEELPVVIGGALVGTTPNGHPTWYWMVPVCIVGVLVGDSFLYGIEIPFAGGHTKFSSMYAAYDRLPADLKRRLDGAMVMQGQQYGVGRRILVEF